MRILFCLSFFSLCAALVSADGSSNAVNERIPVSPAEMEVHWQVDCTNSWARAVELRSRAGSPECVLPADILREFKLCAFIHQPPGQQITHTGPDYQSTSAQDSGAAACLPETPGKQ